MAPFTHEVLNQVPPLVGHNVYLRDPTLRESLQRNQWEWADAQLVELGRRAGSEEALQWGLQANTVTPVLKTHDRYGNRLDEVEFHPAYHSLMKTAVEFGLHAQPPVEGRPGAHLSRAIGFYVWGHADAGHGCPISMTYAAVPALRVQPEVAREWEPLFTSRVYEPGLRVPQSKQGALCGMAMTEKQGGSDVRANTTRAVPAGAAGEFLLTGHKWFCSAPMCDAFLVLAQAPKGLSCFLVPRVLPDGAKNRFFLQRLKDKLGNRSNASSEVEFDDTWARLVGEEGRGVPTIIEMVNHTRLDCVIGSASLMRAALSQAVHHAVHRKAFGRLLIDQPLMQNVLADLALESEAATQVMVRLAAAYDLAGTHPAEALFKRVATAVAKYWVCKRTPWMTAEALECLGGNGYVEDSLMPRMYREAPVNSVWEGSGNVNCLDVLRALGKQPEAVEAFVHEVEQGASEPAIRAGLDQLTQEFTTLADIESRARRVVEKMALLLQASLLVRYSTPAMADAFCRSRLAGDWGHAFGTLPPQADVAGILHRVRQEG